MAGSGLVTGIQMWILLGWIVAIVSATIFALAVEGIVKLVEWLEGWRERRRMGSL